MHTRWLTGAALTLLAALTVTGCARSTAGNVYSRDQARTAQTAIRWRAPESAAPSPRALVSGDR